MKKLHKTKAHLRKEKSNDARFEEWNGALDARIAFFEAELHVLEKNESNEEIQGEKMG